MRIRYFSDKDSAAKSYKEQVTSGNKAILIGPDEFVVAPGPDTKPFVYDPEGTQNLYVVISSVTEAAASFQIPVTS